MSFSSFRKTQLVVGALASLFLVHCAAPGEVEGFGGGASDGYGGGLSVSPDFEPLAIAPGGVSLLNATFTNQSTGTYSRGKVSADFGKTPSWDNGLGQGRAKIVQEGSNKFLRVTYPSGKYGPANSGAQFEIPFGKAYNELWFSYRVRFQSGFAFNMGGKLPGLMGGSDPSGCDPDPNGFSARNMWRTGGAAVQYVYWPNQSRDCGDDLYYRNSGGSNIKFKPGTWHTVKHRIVMNTPGQYNGKLEGYIDGVKYLSQSNRLWRRSGASFGIDKLYFSTFFGGGSQPWASSKTQYADFDNLQVATSKID